MCLTIDVSPAQERESREVAARAGVTPEVNAREVVVAATCNGSPYERLCRETPNRSDRVSVGGWGTATCRLLSL
jgi:hypothetical protein